MNYKSLLKGRQIIAIVALVCFVVIFSPLSVLGQNKVAETKPSVTDSDSQELPPRPKIISTYPPVGATDVDPELTEFSLTFDQDMLDGYSWLFSVNSDDYPKRPEDKVPFWRDKRTCVLPVILEEGKFYCICLNNKTYTNFRSIYDQKLNRTQLYFVTRGASDEVRRRITKPIVVHSDPPNGTLNVDPKTTEFSFTFDVEMGSGQSWCNAGLDAKGYEIARAKGLSTPGGTTSWSSDRRTITTSGFKLFPNKEYKFRFNSLYAIYFRSKSGISMDSHLFTYKTAPGEDIEAKRPRIINTNPLVGSSNVDPELSEITVTFDRDMDMQDHSWYGPESSALSGVFPPVTPGKAPFWRDKRTCVLPVTLAPGEYYRVGVNEGISYTGFHSEEGINPPTTVIYFTTQEASEEVLERLAKPRLVKVEPAQFAQSIDPNTTEIRFTFDVEMNSATTLCIAGPFHAREYDKYPLGSGTRWMADHIALVKAVRLEPNKEYKLDLNNVLYKRIASKWGVPLDPIIYTFTTGPGGTEEK